MAGEKLLKITYHITSKSIHAYLKMPSPTYAVLQRELHMYLFSEQKLPECEYRTYWIDDDGDEIEVVNQNDYDIFFTNYLQSNRTLRMHIAPVSQNVPTQTGANNATAAPAAATTGVNSDDPSAFVIHDRVQCDECDISPIVGFRYKCIQCPNFDLCQRCEAAHKHPEHMFVRMPTNNCPSVVEAWVSGFGGGGHCGRRASKRARNCPFTAATNGGVPSGLYDMDSPKSAPATERHHHGHRRRRTHNGILANLFTMMTDLAEGTEPPTDQTTSSTGADVGSAQKKAPLTETKATETSGGQAQDVPIKVAAAAAQTAAPVNEPQSGNQEETQPPSSSQQQNQQDSTNPATPVINLDALAQYVHPEYMKAGIEILNNFSEMFAKMLDPADGAGDATTGSYNSNRKSSTTSSTSGVSSTSNPISKPGAAEAPSAEPAPAAAASTGGGATPALYATITNLMEAMKMDTTPAENAANDTASVATNGTTISTNTAVQQETTTQTEQQQQQQQQQRRRSQSDDNDWQMIDENLNMPTASVSNSTSIESFSEEAVGSQSIPNSTTKADINFAQLSEDLRAHVEQEEQQQRLNQADKLQQQQISQTVNNETQTPRAPPSVSASTSTANIGPLPTNEVAEEERAEPVYHSNESINKAVKAMMSMGFSNEGAWLTQLLDSVNGNIAEALDLMSASQRNNN